MYMFPALYLLLNYLNYIFQKGIYGENEVHYGKCYWNALWYNI